MKLIANTRGVDPILGSRMLHIQTRLIPEQHRKAFIGQSRFDDESLARLRDEIHTWTFSNVSLISSRYQTMFTKHPDRADDIAAPLRVFADMAGDPGLKVELEAALEHQSRIKNCDTLRPDRAIREAIKEILALGDTLVNVTQVVNELKLLIDVNPDHHHKGEIPEWHRPEWMSTQLRALKIIDKTAAPRRARVWANRYLRFYPLNETFIEELQEELAREGRSVDSPRTIGEFCRGCDACRYRTVGCRLRT